MEKIIIQKVWENKFNGQKAVTIPKECNIKKGDEVVITKIKREVVFEQNGK